MTNLRDEYEANARNIELSTYEGQYLATLSREELMALAVGLKKKLNQLQRKLTENAIQMYQAERRALTNAGFISKK